MQCKYTVFTVYLQPPKSVYSVNAQLYSCSAGDHSPDHNGWSYELCVFAGKLANVIRYKSYHYSEAVAPTPDELIWLAPQPFQNIPLLGLKHAARLVS